MTAMVGFCMIPSRSIRIQAASLFYNAICFRTVLANGGRFGVSAALEGGLALSVFLLVDLAAGKPLVQDAQRAVRRPARAAAKHGPDPHGTPPTPQAAHAAQDIRI